MAEEKDRLRVAAPLEGAAADATAGGGEIAAERATAEVVAADRAKERRRTAEVARPIMVLELWPLWLSASARGPSSDNDGFFGFFASATTIRESID